MSYIVDLTKNRNSKDCSIMGKVLDFKVELEQHEADGLNVYKKNPLVSACDRTVVFYDRHTDKDIDAIMFGSNSYLGVTNMGRVKNKSVEVTKSNGIGSGGVPLLTGTSIYQAELEKIIAGVSGCDDAILFSSGYTANLGAITGLIRQDNLVVMDKLSHASLIDATILAKAEMKRYLHNNAASLEKILKENQEKYPGGILVVTDGVFSMDGDIANIPEILEVVRRYNAVLLIDEAHATGVVGEKGAGTLSHFGIKDRKNIILTGTLSKAIGSVGGYITASQDIIDYLRIYARSNMFSTSLPPSVCASAIEVFRVMDETDIVERLSRNAVYLRDRLKDAGFNVMNTETPIIPLVVGDQAILTRMSKDMFYEGFIVNPIFPPAVPPNLTRFRISVMASHTKEDMDKLVLVIIKLFQKYKIDRYVK